MKDIDDAITKAMDQEAERAVHELARRETLFGQVREMSTGTSPQIVIVGYLFILAFLGLAVWTAISFFSTPDLAAKLAWGLGFIVCFMAVQMLKIWFWMLVMRNKVLREIKRLELQIARLGEEIEAPRDT